RRTPARAVSLRPPPGRRPSPCPAGSSTPGSCWSSSGSVPATRSLRKRPCTPCPPPPNPPVTSWIIFTNLRGHDRRPMADARTTDTLETRPRSTPFLHCHGLSLWVEGGLYLNESRRECLYVARLCARLPHLRRERLNLSRLNFQPVRLLDKLLALRV